MRNEQCPAPRLCKRAIVWGGVGVALSASLFAPMSARAADAAISGVTADGASAAKHDPSLAVDGDPATYWESPGVNSMQDYRRFIDLDLHGLYSVSQINLTLRSGSYYHYGLYVSADGETYNKVAFKTDDEVAGEDAAVHTFDPVEARYVRVAINFNSAAQAVNVAEVSVFGEKISSEAAPDTPIEVEDFANTEWGAEWERVESDAAYAEQKTLDEVRNLVGRVLGEQYADWFVFELRDARDGKDVFEISDAGDGRIKVRGNNGVSLASGLNYYLRNYCKVDYNPLFGSNLDMPKSAPAVGKKLLKYTDYEYRYALNFCTYSYTMAFWDWGEYEPFLDWCAMNGVNLMLDIVGQEEVLRQTLTQYGYTDDEVKEYITGPAYFAWFYMQNMTSAGGPLPDDWFEQRTELARQIHDRMQAYGITPVIQGFGGQVPSDFAQKNPTAVAASSGTWSGYDRPFMIKTYLTEEDKAAGKEDYFDKVGTTFYETQERLFGDVSNYYAVDPFHEGGTLPQGFSIVDIYRVVQEKMIAHDEDAVWVMQQWQWGIDSNKLSGLANKDQALVLDLQSDLRSQAGPMEEVGVPWTWNMLHNFGGRMGMDGVPEVIASDITKAYNSNKYMRGIGITPEAIENSPIVYEMLFDMTWEQDPVDYRSWTHDYVERRYGGTDPKIEEAWDILLDTAYKHKDGEYYQGAAESIMNAKPSDTKISSASTWGHSNIDYDKEEFERAAQLFVESYDTYKDCEAFRYDFVDVMRQVLQNTFQEYQPLAGQAYRDKNLELFQKLSDQMLKIIDAQEKLLATSEDFLLGPWIENARTMLEGADDWTADLFELNARSLVSTWGQQKNSSLVDYSNRQWAGLTGEYYHDRWEMYANNRIEALESGTQASDPNWFMYGWEWANLKSDEVGAYATTASKDDPKQIATEILDKFTIAAMSEYTDEGSAVERVNLASGKTVVDTETNTEVPNVTDGDTDTGWVNPGKKTATLEIDLGGTFDVSGMGLTLQQIPVDYKLSYVMEVFGEDGQWTEVAKSDPTKPLSSKNEIDCEVRGSKVRYKLASTDNQNMAGVYELNVWGAEVQQPEYTNLALGAKATASSTEGIRDVSWGIDGKEDTLWVNSGSGAAWYQVDLTGAQRVDRARLVFESAGRQFKFRVVAGMADGSEQELLDMTNPTTPLDRAYTMEVGADVEWVKVEFTDVSGSAWPAIAELELLQEKPNEVEVENIAGRASITSSPAKPGEGVEQLTDGSATGDADCWVSLDGAKPAWINLAFDKAEEVESVRLLFEQDQPDRSMQFTVTAVLEDGSEERVYERTAADLSAPQGLSIDIPVNKAVKALKVDIQDAKVPSSGGGAWPLVGEIEVLARPRNAAADASVTAGEGSQLSADVLAKLIDGDTTDVVTLASEQDKVITLDLEKPMDIGSVMVASEMGSVPLSFIVEYVPYDAKADEFKTLVDMRGNASTSGQLLARADKPALTERVRLTVHNEGEVKLTEIALYTADVSQPVRDQLAAAHAVLAGVKVGEFAGNYTQASVDALNSVLDEAQSALDAGINSQEVIAWQAKISEALRAFYNEGFVAIDRNALYVALDDAKTTSAALRAQGLGAVADELDAAIAEAEVISDTYQVTQGQIDQAAQKLSEVLDVAMGKLDAATRLQVLIDATEELLAQSQVGEFEGQYPQAAADDLSAAIDAAVKAKDAAAGDETALDAAADALAAAKGDFLKAIVHIDAAAHEAALARAAGYEEAGYDRDAWKAFEGALSEAREVDLSKISQADLDAIASKLANAMDALDEAMLDRTALEAAIGRAQKEHEGDYTPESWKAFKAALDAAIEARDKVSTTQKELDQAQKDLTEAQEGLVAKDHGGSGNGGDSGSDDQGNSGSGDQGGQSGSGSGSEDGSGSGNAGGSGSKPGSGTGEQEGLPTTGDPASLIGVFGAISGASVLGGFAWRKRRNRVSE